MSDWKLEKLKLNKRISLLEALVEKLIAENKSLKLELSSLKGSHKSLAAENKKLSHENIRLRERLGLNSRTSSIPSSKELYKIKKASKPKSERNQGAQPGHEANLRSKLVADEVIKVPLADKECECGGQVSLSDKPYLHQKIDLPEIKPYVREYQLERGRCNSCGKRRSAGLPTGVSSDLFGARVKSVIGSLGGFYKNSKRDIAKILNDIFNLKISVGSISNNEQRISNKCEASYKDIEAQLSYAKLLHIDETSHYHRGKRGWCWLFASKLASIIKLEDSRGKKVLANSVFGTDDHIVVSDRYAAYNYFGYNNRQVCWSHLARDFERFAHSSYPEVKSLGLYLCSISRELFALKKSYDWGEIKLLRFLRRAKKLRKRMYYYLRSLAHKTDLLQAARMARNILKSEPMMWKFLEDPDEIPLTNNHAEQQIRHYVTYRKNSYFTQSDRGKRFLERIISLYLTWKKQGENPVRNLQKLMLA